MADEDIIPDGGEDPGPAPAHHPLVRLWAGFSLIVRESIKSFSRHYSVESAATLAYYGFLSMIPLLLLVIFLLSRFVISSQAALEAVDAMAEQLLPDFGGVVIQELKTLSQQRIWSILTAVVLFWSITPLAAAIRSALARVMTPERPAPFWKARLLDLAGALILLGLFMLVVLGKIIYGSLSSRFLFRFSAVTDLLNAVISFAVSMAALWLFYLAFSSVRLRARELLAGTVVSTALLFILRPAFGLFLMYNPNYGFAFGSLKAIFLIIIWVYLSFVIILLGAEVIANMRRRDSLVLRRVFTPTQAARTHRALLRKFTRRLETGERVFREGSHGHEMYYILSGGIRIERCNMVLRTMAAGEYFGEISMLIDAARTATAVATAAGTELVVIGRDNFDTILREDPQIVKDLLKEMAQRLMTTDERLADRAGGALAGE